MSDGSSQCPRINFNGQLKPRTTDGRFPIKALPQKFNDNWFNKIIFAEIMSKISTYKKYKNRLRRKSHAELCWLGNRVTRRRYISHLIRTNLIYIKHNTIIASRNPRQFTWWNEARKVKVIQSICKSCNITVQESVEIVNNTAWDSIVTILSKTSCSDIEKEMKFCERGISRCAFVPDKIVPDIVL